MRTPRFNIKALVSLTTIVGLLIVIVQQWREIGPLRAEVRRMRNELGYLLVDDPSRAYVIGMRSFENDSWKWRIYLPPGGKYALCERSGRFPSRATHSEDSWFDEVRNSASGMGSTSFNMEGEFVLEGRLIKEGDSWVFVTDRINMEDGRVISSIRSRITVEPASGDWLSDRRARINFSDTSPEQKCFQQGKPILLLNMVRPEITELPNGSFDSEVPQGEADGFAIWIEPVP